MAYETQFNGWDGITLEDLLVVYRKAKADCFFDNTFPAGINFTKYEQDLLVNLNGLLTQLNNDPALRTVGNSGGLPSKKLCIDKKPSIGENGHVHLSKPERTVKAYPNTKKLSPEFRIVGDFLVDANIIQRCGSIPVDACIKLSIIGLAISIISCSVSASKFI